MIDGQSHAPVSRERISAQVQRTIAETFKIPEDQVTDRTVVDDIDGWDSTTHVGLILDLEETLGIEFEIDRVSAFENVGELIDECCAMVNRA